MKTLRYVMVIFTGLLLTGQICRAETQYVTDIFKITMRTGPSIQNKIVVMLKSGEALDVLESKGDWSRVRVQNRNPEESEGWVLTRYLITREPWEDQAKFYRQKHAQLKEQLARIEKEWRETGGREKEALTSLKDTSRQLALLKKEYEELKSGAATYVQLKKDYESNLKEVSTYKANVNRLTNENEILRASQTNKWLGMGALILLSGLFIGISVGKHQKKQRSSVLY